MTRTSGADTLSRSDWQLIAAMIALALAVALPGCQIVSGIHVLSQEKEHAGHGGHGGQTDRGGAGGSGGSGGGGGGGMAGTSCVGDECSMSCPQGFAHCTDDPHDVCETDITSPKDCGACGHQCSSAEPLCSAIKSSGSYECTVDCPPDAPARCEDSCVDLQESTAHCGTCSQACTAPSDAVPRCRDGECDFECAQDHHRCGARCARDDDPTACGALCRMCPAAEGGHAVCMNGSCSVACDGNKVMCSHACVNLTNDAANCGRCGHDCRGAECRAGSCQPQLLLGDVDAPSGFAIDDNSVYFSVDGLIQSCPLSGCTAAPSQIAGGLSSPHDLAVSNGRLAFFAVRTFESLFACPTSGCPDSLLKIADIGGHSGLMFDAMTMNSSDLFYGWHGVPGSPSGEILRCPNLSDSGCEGVSRIQPARGPIAVEGTWVYFMRASAPDASQLSELYRAPVDGDGANATRLLSDVEAKQLVVSGDTVYLLSPYGELWSCASSDGSNQQRWNTPLRSIVQIAADASGVYWTSDQAVYACPRSGCGGTGPRTLASSQASPRFIHTDADFVYWTNDGTTDSSGNRVPATGAIQRVAK